MGLQGRAMQLKQLSHAYAGEFEEIFKVKLKAYLDTSTPVGLITGFDIIKFDEDIRTPDGISCSDHIAAAYGERAGEIVKNLIYEEDIK